MTTSLTHPASTLPLLWDLVAWFIGVHVLGLVAIWYIFAIHHSGATVVLALSLFAMCHLSITAGMHRFYAHQSYRASKPLQALLLLLSAATFQNSALVWAYLHRLHHWYSDTEGDPYSVRHGFWWAHFLWILRTRTAIEPKKVKDLQRNKLVVWQHRHCHLLGLLVGLGLPTAVATSWGDGLGGLLIAGFLRLVVQYHSTWSINSVAHTFGFRRYVLIGTARLNPYLAISTVGENNHERHHLAPEDYRLGPKWYLFDIGKWFIELCAWLRLARGLRTVTEAAVLIRARKLKLALRSRSAGEFEAQE
jgi:stearoyl-CoA desaturase (Delta-9 desaturase)